MKTLSYHEAPLILRGIMQIRDEPKPSDQHPARGVGNRISMLGKNYPLALHLLKGVPALGESSSLSPRTLVALSMLSIGGGASLKQTL